MTSKSQSPGPSATTSQPKVARSRKAAAPGEQSITARAGSAGGVVLEKEQAAKAGVLPTSKTTTKSTARAAAPSQAKDQDAAATGPNRQRRRPRKLTREPAATDNASVTATTTASAAPAPTAELEALKSRVRGLEAKVEELYNKSPDGKARSPRRRGKGRKNSSAQSTATLGTMPVQPDEEDADEELVRLEDELETARHDLEVYQPRKTKRQTNGDVDDDDIEEIPRRAGAKEKVYDAEGRQVTLTGSYRIPLPANLNMDDVKTIQSGVSAAQNVARSFLERRRSQQVGQQSTEAPPPTSKTSKPAPSRKASSSTAVSKETDGKSWGEWIGGYSMAISRVVKNIEAEAAIESQRQAGASASGPGAAGGSSAGKKKAAGKRPAARGRQSSELLG